jgi:hypothetical protein
MHTSPLFNKPGKCMPFVNTQIFHPGSFQCAFRSAKAVSLTKVPPNQHLVTISSYLQTRHKISRIQKLRKFENLKLKGTKKKFLKFEN